MLSTIRQFELAIAFLAGASVASIVLLERVRQLIDYTVKVIWSTRSIACSRHSDSEIANKLFDACKKLEPNIDWDYIDGNDRLIPRNGGPHELQYGEGWISGRHRRGRRRASETVEQWR